MILDDIWASLTLFSQWPNAIHVRLCGKSHPEDGYTDVARDTLNGSLNKNISYKNQSAQIKQ